MPHDPRLNEAYQLDGKYPGLLKIGNINLGNRPMVPNPHGGTSTVDSVSWNVGGHEVLMPEAQDGKIMSARQALMSYLKTGRNLGTFKNPQAANAYADLLHQQQALYYPIKP